MAGEQKPTGVEQGATGTSLSPKEGRPEAEGPIVGKTPSIEDRLAQISTGLEHTQDDVSRQERDNKENKLIMLSVLFIVAVMVATIIVMVLISWSDSISRVIDNDSALQQQIYQIELNQQKAITK